MNKVITIDGPSGSGKGTIAVWLADYLGWQCLDSGALYRVLGEAAIRSKTDLSDESALADLAKQMKVEFNSGAVLLNGEDVSDAIRTETAGNNASKVAAMPAVRQALLEWQKDQAVAPGLVADGRDMGTEVFPAARIKIFLTASAENRADRRYKQLKEKGLDVNLADLIAEISERDARDKGRAVCPLRPADDAVVIDSSHMNIEEVQAKVLEVIDF